MTFMFQILGQPQSWVCLMSQVIHKCVLQPQCTVSRTPGHSNWLLVHYCPKSYLTTVDLIVQLCQLHLMTPLAPPVKCFRSPQHRFSSTHGQWLQCSWWPHTVQRCQKEHFFWPAPSLKCFLQHRHVSLHPSTFSSTHGQWPQCSWWPTRCGDAKRNIYRSDMHIAQGKMTLIFLRICFLCLSSIACPLH